MGRTLEDVPASAVSTVDFRRPSRIGRDAVVMVEAAHEGFSRRLGTAWGNVAHAALELEHVSTEQCSVDDYVRALPNPTVLTQLRVDRLGGTVALLEIDLPLGLLLVERVLGGAGDARMAPAVRRPTDLETALLRAELIEPAVAAIDAALGALEGEPTTILSFETTPQPVQLHAAGELLMLLTYRVEIRGDLPGQGLVTVAYPVSPLLAHVDGFLTGVVGSDDEVAPEVAAANRSALLATTSDVAVQLGSVRMDAGTLAALAPGDVVRLDHRVGDPASVVLEDRQIGTAHLGRRGRRLAVQIATPLTGL
ncbi:flagellar motor switch protein FliM [Nitriliruptor alkaliphilus]|uniref:flagellar motor switch protein FliM n=1 Tax=Nitriliruptor alkaliphilus TaxID=427918 RepID=UPI000698B261|nr:FliM/FliN family flagellar motor switch protein [Nitriliruptor alkaliphilus]